jgi:hypothetical protein
MIEVMNRTRLAGGLAGRPRRRLRCEVVDGSRYQDGSDGRWYPGFGDRYPEPEGRYDDDRYRTPEPRHGDLGESSGDLGRYRDPEHYPVSREARPDPLTDPALTVRSGALGPRSGVELPPLSPASDADRFAADPRPGDPRPGDPRQAEPRPGEPRPGEPRFGGEPRFQTEPLDRAALRRPPAAGPVGPSPAAGGPTVVTEPVGGAIYRTRRAGVAVLLAFAGTLAELLALRILVSGEFGHPMQPGTVLAGTFALAGIPLTTTGLYGLMTGAATTAAPTPGRAWLRTPLAYLPVGLALLIGAALAG